jgi:hypothetical protein
MTQFSIPAYNGIISFAENGTYSSATLESNTWIFTYLLLNGSQLLANLEISIKNSNVTIISYTVTSINFPSNRLSYSVEGEGQQVINMGLGFQGNSADWIVTSNGTFLNTGWSVSRNGTVTVTGLTGKISIVYFGFTNQLGNSNAPFYEQHSIAIAVVLAVVFTVVAAGAVRISVKRHSGQGELNTNA